MKPEWFFRHEGQAHGPVTIAEVRRMLKSERLKSTDHVRYADDVEWMLVSDFLSRFNRREQPEAPDRNESNVATESDRGPSILSALAAVCGKLASESAFQIANVFSRLWELLAIIPDLRRSWITVAVLAILSLAYAFKDTDFSSDPTQQTINQLLTIEEELDLLQGRNSSSNDWSEFQQTTGETLSLLQQSLKEQARNNPRLRSHYWTESGYRQSVARSELIKACQALRLLVDSRGEENHLRVNFHHRIDLAHTHALYGLFPSPSSVSDWDGTTIGILCFDVALVFGAAAFWWWRRNQRIQPTS